MSVEPTDNLNHLHTSHEPTLQPPAPSAVTPGLETHSLETSSLAASSPGLSSPVGIDSAVAASAMPMAGAPAPAQRFYNRPILYEEPLKWFLLLSCLDILFTWIVLHMGGSEVNWLARLFLEHGDLYGLVAFKFTMVVFIILLCDFVGRRNDSRGRFIARAAVIITSFPVILASMQLLIFMYA